MMDLSKENTILEVESFGKVELKYVSLNDWIKFSEIISNKHLNYKEATQEIIHHQIIKPKINADKLKQLPDSDLIKISRAFIGKHRDYEFKDFKDTGDFFQDFIDAIKIADKKQNEEFSKTLEPIIKSTQEFSRKITEQFKEIQSRFAELVKPIKFLVPQINLWQKWVEDNKITFNNFGKYWDALQKEYNISKQKAIKILKRYKWFVTPSMPINFVFRVVKLAETKGRHDSQINNLFISYFSTNNWHNLEQMVDSWKANPLLKKRMNILLDCVKTLKKTKGSNINQANVILPTLIAQIDGLLTDYLKSKNLLWKCSYSVKKTEFKKANPKISMTQLDDLASDIFLEILFQESQRGKPLKTPFNFNRHKIIHGESVEYGKKDYLIRAFLVIDFLASLK